MFKKYIGISSLNAEAQAVTRPAGWKCSGSLKGLKIDKPFDRETLNIRRLISEAVGKKGHAYHLTMGGISDH